MKQNYLLLTHFQETEKMEDCRKKIIEIDLTKEF